MKNVFIKSILVLFVISLFSCGDMLPMNDTMDNPYKVLSIKEWSGNKCIYVLSSMTDGDHIEFIDNIEIVDNVGKYAIGDYVRFYSEKDKSLLNLNNEYDSAIIKLKIY